MTHQQRPPNGTSDAIYDAFEVLISFGALMWRAGNTAIRTREWMEVLAKKMDFDAIAVGLSLESITVSARGSNGQITAMRVVAPQTLNARRIAELEELARAVEPRFALSEVKARMAAIEAVPPLYSRAQIAGAVALASGSFAFLNGAGGLEIIATAIGGGVGQWFRQFLSHRQLNQYGVAALTAILASGTYVLVTGLAGTLGFGFAHYPIGFIASVLFLVPGFPLIGALFDLLQLQTVAAISRLANGVMILLAVALGLSIVIALAGVDPSRPAPIEIAYPIKLLLRAVASFLAGSAFSLLFNTPARTVLAVGLLALFANSLRLLLNDMGLMLAPAAFIGAFTIGLVTLVVDQHFTVPRIAMTVAPIVIMIPGLYAFDAIVLFNQGQALEALQAAARCGFIVGALAMGLATARFFSPDKV
jgi:uncharacterized membrane protein YjjP (DUF1212 family)